MPYFHANGIQMYYEVHGKGDPLVLIQGFTENLLVWKTWVEILKNDFQVILLDNRGSGRTQQPTPPYSIELMADDLYEILKELNIEKAHVVGHSMGGAIAQAISYKHPEMINKLILISSFAKLPHTTLMQIDTVIEMAIMDVPYEMIVKNAIPWLYSSNFLEKENIIDKMIHHKVSDPFPQTPEGYMGQGEALKNFNSLEKLGNISCPTFLIVGEHDFYTPPSCTKTLQENIKNSQMKIFPLQSHMIVLEMPEEICSNIKEFIKR